MEEAEDDHEYQVMYRFPLLSASEDFTKWTGFISTAHGKTILLSLQVPQFPHVDNIRLVTEDLNGNAVRYWTPYIEQNSMVKCGNFLEYLNLLEAQVHQIKDSVRDSGGDTAAVENSDLCTTVIEEVEAIGVKNVVYLSPDFREIVIMHMDKSGRENKLKLKIPEEYPTTKPTVNVELPFPPDSIKWPERIREINQMFVKYLEKSCYFWDEMEDLDRCVTVLDPMQPSKSHFHRRILLEDNVTLHLVFNASAPRALPQISFAGPKKLVEAFNASVDQECHNWDITLKVFQNLKSILNCEFATREDEDEESDQIPCTICYVHNFEGEIPEISCCNCEAVFHRQCICDLFAMELTKKGLNPLKRCVDCPGCQMEITVPQTGFKAGTW